MLQLTPQMGTVATVHRVEVCTGFKLKPEPGPYPRLSDPIRAAQLHLESKPQIFFPLQRIANKKINKKAAFHDSMHRPVSKYTKKRIHQGSAISQDKI